MDMKQSDELNQMNDGLSSTRSTVLVVDDAPENIDILNNALSEEFDLIVATSGEKGLAIVEAKPPDLILLDIMMPGMDGYEVCQRLKQNPATGGIPVIFITALNASKNEELGFKTGCVDYLTKPINPAVALARVKTHLAMSNSRKELMEQNSSLQERVEALSSLATERDQEHATLLTPRQHEILAQVSRGLNYKDVALVLDISETTVKFHMKEIIERLQLENRTQAVAYYIKHLAG